MHPTTTPRTVAPVALAVILSFALAGAAMQPAADPPPKPPQPIPAPQQPARAPGPGADSRRAERPSVSASMKLMDRSLQQLRDQIGDPAKKDDNLRLVNEVQRGAINAKGQPLPRTVLEKVSDEATRAKMTAGFRNDLIALIRKLLDIETDIADGKTDAALAHLDDVAKLADAAHGRLFPEHEDHEDHK
jgi:hypothetical protein